MQKFDIKKVWPYMLAIIIFVVLSLVYVSPVLEGKRLMQPDFVKFSGMAKEINDFREETGQEALWTNSMFGGMPAFQISVVYANNIALYANHVFTLGLPRPADMIFLYFVGFFILLLLLKVNPWLAMAGAIGFTFSTYNFIIIEAGHNTKALAIAYMAPVLASIIYTFKGRYIAGSVLFTLFLALQLYANHLQITYYLLIIVVFYGAFELYQKIQQKNWQSFLKPILFLMIGAIFAIGVNISNFWSTYVYASETMRGGTELSIDKGGNSSGLEREYITAWSYGLEETLTLLVPNAKGGASGALLLDEILDAHQGTPAQQRAARTKLDAYHPGFVNFLIEGLQSGNPINSYWGNQPFTSGPVYLGAVIMFLFFLSLFFVKGPVKYGLVVAIVLSIMLAWGKNFPLLTDFFIEYVPGYNKFRAVSMTLVIAGLCVPVLAFLGLHKLYQNPGLLKIRSKAFYTALACSAGLLIVLYVMPSAFLSFFSDAEKGFLRSGNLPPQMLMQFDELERVRIEIFRADTMRSLIFVLLTAALVGLWSLGKIKGIVFASLLGVLLLIDLWPINKRYFDHSNFVSARQIETPFQPTQADMKIKQDETLHFRVYNLSLSSFNDASTSYFHSSIGGYHGAKLQRYQELIDHHIQEGNMKVLNMLNTRYLITRDANGRPEARRNWDAMGNAWFVKDVEWMADAGQEIQSLHTFDPSSIALIDESFEKNISQSSFDFDPYAIIDLTEYAPNRLVYHYTAASEQLAVFSEIYYPHGWKVFLNGEEQDYFRANYILRAMLLPAGEGEIEFRFEPKSYYLGERIALIFSILLALSMLFYLVIMWVPEKYIPFASAIKEFEKPQQKKK